MAVGYIVVYLRKGIVASAALWFTILSVVFFLYSFVVVWSESNFNDLDGIATGVLVVSLGLVSFIAGSLVLGGPKGRRHTEKRHVRRDPTVRRVVPPGRGLFFIAAAVIVPSVVYFVLLGHVPLFMGVGDVFESGYQGLGALQTYRLELTPHLSGMSIPFKGVFDIIRNYGPLFIVGVSTVQMLQGEKRWPRILLIVLGVVTSLAAGQRWPLIYLFVAALAAIYALVGFGIRPALRRVVGFSALLIGVGLVITLLQKRTTEVIDSFGEAVNFVFENLFQRIIFDQSATPILSFQNRVYNSGELGGASYLQALLAYVPGSDVQNFEVDFFSRIYGSSYGYTAAPGFFTEAFINFGLIGVALLSFAWGMLLTTIDRNRQWEKDRYFSPGFKAAIVALLAGTSFAGVGVIIGAALIYFYMSIVYRLGSHLEKSDTTDFSAAELSAVGVAARSK
nr:O-antigen polymerase [Microbacterium pseudoresistens]